MAIKKKNYSEESTLRGYQPISPEPEPSAKGYQPTIESEKTKKEPSPPQED